MRSSVRVVLVVVAVLAASALAWRGLFVTDSAADLIVTSATGATVRAAGAAITRPVRAGHIVRSRDQLAVEEGGRAVLEMGDATRLELAERSSIRVLEVDEQGVRVELEGGRLEARVTPSSPVLGIASRGREIVAMDADVRVGVDPDGGLAVRPSRGSVQLVGIDGVQSLQAGERLGALPEQPGVVDDATMQLLLQVSWPETAVREEEARLEGRTAPYAAVRVSGPDGERQTIRAGRDGEFTASVALTEGPNTISMTASDPTGVQATAEARIERDSRPPSAISVEVGW